MDLKKEIENHVPFNEQELVDKVFLLKSFETFDDLLTRGNQFFHISSSAFVVNENRDRMLMVYHNIYDGWIYPGGHADGVANLSEVAVREATEETGLKAVLLDEGIYSMQSLPITGHVKRGAYVPAHIHFDINYLMEADDGLDLQIKEDENSGVKWFDFEVSSNDNVVDFARPVNRKNIQKIRMRGI